MQKPKIKIALSGNPNCGKSSLFNILTGLNQKISNIPGTTIERKKGRLIGNREVEIMDLPGIYSIYPKSYDEYIACAPLVDPEHADRPDMVVMMLDASNLKRNLLLASQISDLGHPVVWCLNMSDVAAKKGLHTDIELMGRLSGVPIIELNARTGKGVELLIPLLTEEKRFTCHYSFIEEKDYGLRVLHHYRHVLTQGLLNQAGNKEREKETEQRYAAIGQLVQKVQHKKSSATLYTGRIDALVLHRFWGIFIFAALLFLIFQSIFNLAQYPMDWIEAGFGAASDWLNNALPKVWWSALIIDGILPGIAGILVFIPQIFLLFFFLGIMEDTGYMARVSFIMDQIVRRFGLNGKSVIPMISGTACAIPAIMATRNIENWKDRLITIMVTPLISCSARLPVYILLISLFVPDTYVWGVVHLQGLVLFFMYLLGFVASLFAAIVFKWIISQKQQSFFILELPVYHLPRWKDIVLNGYNKVKSFVLEAGKIILIVSMILWALASYGPGETHNMLKQEMAEQSNPEIKLQLQSEMLEYSYAGVFGRAIEPVIQPLGFNWKIGIALFTSFAAREVFVGTMSTIYSVGSDASFQSIRIKMLEDKDPNTGKPVYSTAVALSLMIFYAFAMQCVSTLAVVKKETNGWKWPMIQLLFMTILAYMSSLTVFQILG